MKYTEIVNQNRKLKPNPSELPFKIKILSNVIVHQLNEILEYNLRIEGVPAEVSSGNYDNIMQDIIRCNDSQVIIIFWELCNLTDGLYFQLENFRNKQISLIEEKLKSEIKYIKNNINKESMIYINRFTAMPFSNHSYEDNKLDSLSKELNKYLEKFMIGNINLVDIENIIASVGFNNTYNYRDFYSSKILYKPEYFKKYAEIIKYPILSNIGKLKKAIIFDCDNTLWKGILGEDGFDNIEMSHETRSGFIFAEIQNIALSLSKRGVIICICSKNNPEDIDQVLNEHKNMILKDKFITIKKVNWRDKASNIRLIAEELNIGLDSLVFVDDSSFEINLIKDKLPEVRTIQVPENLYQYPKKIRENLGLFYNADNTKEDYERLKMYNDQKKRNFTRKSFNELEDYLRSLKLSMIIKLNSKKDIKRISQLSQKTNQFNLTTKRYKESDIKIFMDDLNFDVITISLKDKFGDYGITGLSIIKCNKDSQHVIIDTFLLSCRIIGRNVEFVFFDFLIDFLKRKKIKTLETNFFKTKKNDQVKNFYDSCSLERTVSDKINTKYFLDLKKYKSKKITYIEVING